MSARFAREMRIGNDSGVDPTSSMEDPRARIDHLYRHHAAALRRRLRARLGSADEANEVLQDAFTRLLGGRALEDVREPGAFLNRIVRNLLIDRSRRRATRPVHVPIEEAHDRPIAAEQERAMEYEQMRDRYKQLIASLPPRMREVFVLHRIDGLSYKEIAQRLDISVRTVEWHIAEAIVRISKGLDRE